MVMKLANVANVASPGRIPVKKKISALGSAKSDVSLAVCRKDRNPRVRMPPNTKAWGRALS